MPAALEPIDTVADLIRRLGDIPPERILWNPIPGTATEADALRLNDGEPKRLVELIDGILVEKAVGLRESFLASWLIVQLGGYVNPRKLGLVGAPDALIRILPAQLRLPDVSYFPWKTLPKGEAHASIGKIAPALACEIISDSNTPREIQRKLKEFFSAGTKLFWVIDPKTETIEVYTKPTKPKTLTTADTLDGGRVLPGFSLSIADLFGYLDFPSE